jgi:legume-like lectin family protein/PEP-CTERM motif-containing protein
VVQTQANNVGGGGGGIGYEGISPSLGIEFDNFENGDNDGTPLHSGSHIGVDLNGSVESVAVVDSPFNFDPDVPVDLTAWVDYDGSTGLLEVRINDSVVRPLAAVLSYNIDLSSIFGVGSPAFVGFTSGTGSGYANHDLASWEFRDSFDPVTGAVPEPAAWAMMLAGFGLVGGALRRRTPAALLA